MKIHKFFNCLFVCLFELLLERHYYVTGQELDHISLDAWGKPGGWREFSFHWRQLIYGPQAYWEM